MEPSSSSSKMTLGRPITSPAIEEGDSFTAAKTEDTISSRYHTYARPHALLGRASISSQESRYCRGYGPSPLTDRTYGALWKDQQTRPFKRATPALADPPWYAAPRYRLQYSPDSADVPVCNALRASSHAVGMHQTSTGELGYTPWFVGLAQPRWCAGATPT
jgi:hypothetical protein